MTDTNALIFTYRNHSGDVAERHVIPIKTWYGTTEWHKKPTWLLQAYDLDRGALRDFDMREFGGPPQHGPFVITEAQLDGICKAAVEAALFGEIQEKAGKLPWRRADIERGLILFRTSNNASGFTNCEILTGRVDALPQQAKEELATVMFNVAAGLTEMKERQRPTEIMDKHTMAIADLAMVVEAIEQRQCERERDELDLPADHASAEGRFVHALCNTDADLLRRFMGAIRNLVALSEV